MISRKDIAEKLGVSVSVVSRALNNSGYVQAEKKDLILRTARDMGYTREPQALRALSRATRQIMIYTPNSRNPFYVEFQLGVADVMNRNGYSILTGFYAMGENTGRFEGDGCVFTNEIMADDYMKVHGMNESRPMVCASFGFARQLSSHVKTVECDLWEGAQNVIDYLRRRGHVRIAMVSPYPRDNTDGRTLSWTSLMLPVFGSRISDYYVDVSDVRRSRMPEGSLPAGGSGIAGLTGEDFFENGCLAAERFVQSGCDATAVVCFNEEMGVGFCKTLRRLKVRVPEDVSVIAYDGTYLRRYFDRPLTVLDMQPFPMGRRCATLLLNMLEGRRARNVRMVPSKVLEGETVADCTDHRFPKEET